VYTGTEMIIWGGFSFTQNPNYLPPVAKSSFPVVVPPQTIISEPVQTAVAA
jgi:hypothetical protein